MDQKAKTSCLICLGTSCVKNGSLEFKDQLLKELDKKGIRDRVSIQDTGCHGLCHSGPILVTTPLGTIYHQLKPEHISTFVDTVLVDGESIPELILEKPETPSQVPAIKDTGFYSKQVLVALHNRGMIDPDSIDEYIGRDGYRGTAKALLEMKPEEIVEEMKASGLRGRGGAGFPTGLKWQFCAQAEGSPKYILCNADEGDPGAFMDRSILESDPHAVLEGMIIGAKAIGAHQGYIYVRAEYPLAIKRLQRAIEQAKNYGLLGEDILGSGFDMNIELYFGAGAFVCGEETALMRSIEGKRGMPRPRPPFPAQKGLWEKPTVLNNVESLANVPRIIFRGSGWFSSLGTPESAGTKVFALSGQVRNIGLIEVPMGIPLRSIVFDIGGGIPGGHKLKAVQIGGPSGGCVPMSLIDTAVDYESIPATGAIVGSGGMVVMDETSCMVDVARFFLEFTAEESCGKCTPCREGTRQLLEILDRITTGRGVPEDLDRMVKIGKVMQSASLCGLGQTAANPVMSTLRYFRHEYEAHILDKHCPTHVCKRLSAPPCQTQCPMGQDVSTYTALIALGKIDQAWDIIRRENPFPMTLGRVCPHPCESSCKRGDVDTPIAICHLKRFVADQMRDRLEEIEPVPVKFPEDKVAVIGAGPAGLTAAADLANRGYPVTVFEALPVPGGMLATGIPDYRLPKEVLNAEIGAIEKLGVTIILNTKIGKDITIADLKAQGFKAFFIGIGAHQGLRLHIPGENEFDGVLDAITYLREVNLNIKTWPESLRVIVIGGGNSAIDAARTALRLHAKEVRIVYRRQREQMPANPAEIEAALEEGVHLDFLTTPLRVLGKDGKVTGLRCLRNELGKPDMSGRRRPIPIEGSDFESPCDLIIPAISQEPDLSLLPKAHQFSISRWKSFVVDETTLATNVSGFFAGGDGVTGPAMVVDAIAAGHRAAVSINCYLRGTEYRGYWYPRPHLLPERVEPDPADENLVRPKMKEIPVSLRLSNFDEVELGLGKDEAIKEARRCLRCDL